MKIEKEDLKIKGICLIQLAIAAWYLWRVLKTEVPQAPARRKHK